MTRKTQAQVAKAKRPDPNQGLFTEELLTTSGLELDPGELWPVKAQGDEAASGLVIECQEWEGSVCLCVCFVCFWLVQG